MLLTCGSALAAGQQPQTITEKMSCAACGMYPHRYPQWQTQIIFTDGTMAAFDGGKCMFRFLLNMQKFSPERKPEQVAAVWVKDFTTGSWIDGKAAHYVIDSKELGPMGKELDSLFQPHRSGRIPEKKRRDHRNLCKHQYGHNQAAHGWNAHADGYAAPSQAIKLPATRHGESPCPSFFLPQAAPAIQRYQDFGK